MSTQTGTSGVTFPDATLQTTAAVGGGIGTGQTWYTAGAGIRVLGVTYTNMTLRPIQVSVVTANNIPSQGAGVATVLTVGGIAVATESFNLYGQSGSYPTFNANQTVEAIVPAGVGYKVVTSGGTGGSISLWNELTSIVPS